MSRLAAVTSLVAVLILATVPLNAQSVSTSTVVSGLSDPRGTAFAPERDLYIAEAWTAPGTLTTTNCFQSAIGPFTAGFTSRISRVRKGSTIPEIVADGFPSRSAQTPDYEPDGLWFGMGVHRGQLLAVEANHGLLVEIDATGGDHSKRGDAVTLVADLFKRFGDNTYTSLASRGGELYVGTYGRFDNNFSGGIYRLSKRGGEQIAGGLTSVLGVAFDREGRLYAIQAPIFDGGGAGLGSLVRIERDRSHTVLLTGLASPGSITRGPDGALYIPQCSFHCAPEAGWITRVQVGR